MRNAFQRRRAIMTKQFRDNFVEQTIIRTKDQTNFDDESRAIASGSSEEDMTDMAFSYLKANYPKVYQFLQYDAPLPADPMECIRAIKLLGERAVMEVYRTKMNEDTMKLYDEKHPQLRQVA